MNNYRIQNVSEDPMTNLDNALRHINKILKLSGSDSLNGINAEMAITYITMAKKDLKNIMQHAVIPSAEEMNK